MFKKYTNSFLNDFDFDQILSKFKIRDFQTFEKGSFIFSENTPVTNIYFILSGKVRIKKSTRTLYEAGAGDLIGLDDALIGNLYSGSAYVVRDANTVSVHKKNFLNILKDSNEFNLWILKYLTYRIDSLG